MNVLTPILCLLLFKSYVPKCLEIILFLKVLQNCVRAILRYFMINSTCINFFSSDG